VTELVFDDPCVVFALRRESQVFRRHFRAHQTFPGAPCRAQFCGPEWLTVLVLETGTGAAQTEAALRWMLDRPLLENVPYRPRVVLSSGFSGALQEDFRPGDIILATEIDNVDGDRWPTTWPPEMPAGEWRPHLHRGRIVSVSRLIGNPDEKRLLGREHEALAVDMETATVARLCHEKGVPFGCVRAISDDVGTGLSPQLLALLARDRVSPLHVIAALVSRPRLVGEMWRLARNTRVAARQLAVALGEVLTLTLPWGADPHD
jgi:adenosylhomocysteine nucleosidase